MSKVNDKIKRFKKSNFSGQETYEIKAQVSAFNSNGIKSENKRFLNFCLWYNSEKQQMHISDMLADTAHRAGLKINFLVAAGTLRNESAMEKLNNYAYKWGDSITIWLEPDEQMLDELGIIEGPCFFCYYSKENKYKLAGAFSELYENKTSGILKSIAYFNLDATSLVAFKKTCPSLICAMAACFEEGINVLHGHRYFDLEWLCWTEGGPWSPWIPRKENALVPAAGNDDKIELVCVPHLNRDLIQAFDRRNDWYSSQPMDEMRGKAVRRGNIGFSKQFFAEYMKQAELNNGFAYYQFIEGFGPFDEKCPHVFDEDCDEIQTVYEEYVNFLGTQVKSGKVKNCSLEEFGTWYYREYDGGSPPVMSRWHDLLYNSGKEYLWYIDRNFRVLFAPQRGGAILDLRPYKIGIAKSAGRNAELWDLSNPYIIQNHHRYTSIFKGMVKYEGELIDLSERIFQVNKIRRGHNETIIVYHPLELVFKAKQLTLNTKVTITGYGDIITEREVVSREENNGIFEFCEYLHGTFGTTDLPVNLEGIRLGIGLIADSRGISYAHLGRVIIQEETNECRVAFPKYDFYVSLKAEGPGCKTRIEEGTLFQAFYTLSIEKEIKLRKSASFRTILSFEKAAISRTHPDESSAFPGRKCAAPFKTAWAPSAHPLRCPKCLHDEREVHLIEKDGDYRCQFCSFTGTAGKIQELYRELIPEGCR